MKKGLGLLFITMVVGLAGFTAIKANSNYVSVLAEGETSEQTFVQKTYVYEVGENRATLVLLSPTEFSMTVNQETISGAYERDGNILTLAVNDSSLIVQVNDVMGTFVETIETDGYFKGAYEWIKTKWNTFVVPVLGGTMGISLIAGLISVGMTLAKNKDLNKKLIELKKMSDESLGKAESKYLEVQQILVQITDVLTKINTIYETVVASGELNAQIKMNVESKLKEMSSLIKNNTDKLTKIDDLIKINALLIELESKVAKQSKEVVKSGIIQDIEEINNLIKNI